jgi:hypothetical protein
MEDKFKEGDLIYYINNLGQKKYGEFSHYFGHQVWAFWSKDDGIKGNFKSFTGWMEKHRCFLAEGGVEKKEVPSIYWINVYRLDNGKLHPGEPHKSKEKAIEAKNKVYIHEHIAMVPFVEGEGLDE